jgi:hypothetical protein
LSLVISREQEIVVEKASRDKMMELMRYKEEGDKKRDKEIERKDTESKKRGRYIYT